MRSLLTIIIIAIAFTACNNTQKSDKYIVTPLERNDQTFLSLKDTAQQKLNIFIDSLKAHGNDTSYVFAVKSDFVDGEDHEHMWSRVFAYNGKFTGVFTDSAFVLRNIKMGEKVLINKKDIEDWVIYDNLHNTETGNFSDKYLRSKAGQ